MLDMVDKIKASPWGEVEQVLELLRAGLVLANKAWAFDQLFAREALRCEELACAGLNSDHSESIEHA
jgi:hypothetical protein